MSYTFIGTLAMFGVIDCSSSVANSAIAELAYSECYSTQEQILFGSNMLASVVVLIIAATSATHFVMFELICNHITGLSHGLDLYPFLSLARFPLFT